MTDTTVWQGPCESPFVAASKALDKAGMDTTEFSTFRMWDMAGEYPFFSKAEDFIEDLCAHLAQEYGIVVQRRDDGFYATYDEHKGESSYVIRPMGKRDDENGCRSVLKSDEGADCFAIFFVDGEDRHSWVADFVNKDDAILFVELKK